MGQIKAHEFDGLLARGAPAVPIVLVYGPDRGLVSERADKLARTTGVPLDDAFALVRLDAGEIQGGAGRLIDEANSIPLFGGRRLIWIKAGGNERALVEAIDYLAANPPVDCLILIEAGDLKKGATLRRTIEESRTALAIPCYADEGRAIHGLIDDEMAAAGLRLTAGARLVLVDQLGGDRLASRSELQKLALYARGKDVVDEADVVTIIGDASALSVDDAVDAVLTGDTAGLDLALQRIAASKTSVFLALQSCLRQFQLLETMRMTLEIDRKPAAAIMNEQGRRIHFKRKPAVEKALQRWSCARIDQALQHLQSAILETRRRPGLEHSIARQGLMALAIRSARAAA